MGILEFLFVLIFGGLGDLIHLFVWHSGESKDGDKNNAAEIVICILFGVVFGGFSVLFLPHLLLEDDLLQLSNLLASPILFGLIMMQIGKRRLRNGKIVTSLEHFWYAWLFAVFFILTRAGVAEWLANS